jgi:hypothetical protein
LFFDGVNLVITVIVSASSFVTSSSKDSACWFDIFGKRHGHLLDTSNMMSIPQLALGNSTSFDPSLGSQQEPRRLTLQISDHKHLQQLSETIEELRRAIANCPMASKPNRASIAQARYVLPTPMA